MHRRPDSDVRPSLASLGQGYEILVTGYPKSFSLFPSELLWCPTPEGKKMWTVNWKFTARITALMRDGVLGQFLYHTANRQKPPVSEMTRGKTLRDPWDRFKRAPCDRKRERSPVG